MPKVKMMAGIAAISGKFGNMYFRTDKKSGRVSLCNLPKTQCALTEKQKLHHARCVKNDENWVKFAHLHPRACVYEIFFVPLPRKINC